MKKYLFTTALAAVASVALAQDLRTEITVDRTVQPALRDMSRISGVAPAIPAPSVAEYTLEAAEYTDPGEVDANISVLRAAAWADSIPRTPYRGYASAGYLPLYNVEANAGYRFVDTPKVGLGLWMQYNGNSYNGDMHNFDGALYTNHTATMGGNMAVRFTQNSRFTGKGHATYKSIRVPYFMAVGDYLTNPIPEYQSWRSYRQSARDISGSGRWQSRTGDLMYALHGTISYFTLGNERPASIRTTSMPVRQAFVKGGASAGIADERGMPWLGMDLEYGVLRSRGLQSVTPSYTTAYHTQNFEQGSFRPFLRFGNDDGLDCRLGLNLGFGKGYHAKTTLAPDVHVSWRPVPYFVAYAHLEGDNHFNLMSELLDLNPYIDPSVAYGRTNMKLIARGGLNLGPYDGMELGVYGGYAMARDYLSPLIVIARSGLMTSSMINLNIDSWYIGAHVGLRYQRLFALGFDIKYGGANRDTHSWYEWVDAAKVVASASLRVTPTEPLEVTLGYDMRYQRKATSIVYPFYEISNVMYVGTPNLGTVNCVNLGGSYRVTPQITAFGRIENLLNCQYKLISGMPAQGIHGLLGASYKF